MFNVSTADDARYNLRHSAAVYIEKILRRRFDRDHRNFAVSLDIVFVDCLH